MLLYLVLVRARSFLAIASDVDMNKQQESKYKPGFTLPAAHSIFIIWQAP